MEISHRFLRSHLARNQTWRNARTGRGQLTCEVQSRELAAHFGLPKGRLAQRVRQAVRIAFETLVLTDELRMGKTPAVGDVWTKVSACVLVEAVQNFIQVPVSLIALLVKARGQGNEEKQVFASFWGNTRIGDRRRTDIEQRVVRPSLGIVDGLCMRTKRRVKEQVVMLQFRDPGVQSDIEEERTRRHGSGFPIRIVVASPLFGQQVLFHVMVIARGDDRGPFHERAVREVHA